MKPADSSEASVVLLATGVHGEALGQVQHHTATPRLLTREARPVRVGTSQTARAARVALIRDAWLAARSGRRVVISRGYARLSAEPWIAVATEDEKGIVSARGSTWLEALARALGLLGLSIPN